VILVLTTAMRTNQCLHLLVPVVDDTLAEVDCTVVVMADDRETDGVDAVEMRDVEFVVVVKLAVVVEEEFSNYNK